MANPPYSTPWPLHYQHRDGATSSHREAPPAPPAPPARRDPYDPHMYARHAAQTTLDTHQTNIHTLCKGENEEPRADYREHYHVHRCSAAYGKCVEAGEEPREEPVSSTAEHQHWDEKLVSSSLCSRPSTSGVGTASRAEAASPHQLVTTTHAGSGSGRRGALQLWQFLVSLLAEGARCVAWTGRGLEFKLHEPEEVARRWGAQKNRPAMNYDKLSRSLRYYYEKGIMQKVAGERYVYKFVCDPEALFSMASPRPRSPPAAPPPPPPYDVISQLYGGVVYPQYLPGVAQQDYQGRRYYNHLGHYDT